MQAWSGIPCIKLDTCISMVWGGPKSSHTSCVVTSHKQVQMLYMMAGQQKMLCAVNLAYILQKNVASNKPDKLGPEDKI